MVASKPLLGIFTILLLLIAVNLVWLDIITYFELRNGNDMATTQVDTSDGETCGQVCQDAIVSNVISRMTTPVISPPAGNVVASTGPQASRENYVPLGSGTTTSNQYVAVAGAEAYIDTSLYGTIMQATFEVFLRNPTGNGVTYAKLYNATDGHDVWFSEVSMVGGGIALQDATITLDPGNKLYQVYLKSTLAYDVYADNARVRIITQ